MSDDERSLYDDVTGRFHVEVFPAKSGNAQIAAFLAPPADDGPVGRDD